MSALSDYLEAAYLDLVYNGVPFDPPAAVYVALYTSDPTDADTGTEVSGGGYARVQVNPSGGGAPEFALAVTDGAGKLVANAHDIVFPAAVTPWGTITHFGPEGRGRGREPPPPRSARRGPGGRDRRRVPDRGRRPEAPDGVTGPVSAGERPKP